MTGSDGIADAKRRALLNAQGALRVVQTASETVDTELETIDDLTATQDEEMQAVLSEVSDLSATIAELSASAAEIDDRAERATGTVAEGHRATVEARSGMETVSETSERAAEEVDRLRTQIDSIESALSGIDDIAEQTNLLALNASIEAARTGAESNGFAVVAEEIKALAAESQEQADEIARILREVRSATEATVERLRETIDEIESTSESVERAAESLDEVADIVEATADDVAAMSATTEEQASVSETVTERCERVAERTADVDAGVADIRDAREEQTTMLGEIDQIVQGATPTPGTVDRIPTGVPALDERVGGFVRGGQAVVRSDGTDIGDLVARCCEAALSAGLGVSLTPPPDLDAAALGRVIDDYRQEMADDRLFVLDGFDEWSAGRNVFDLSSTSLSSVNRTTVQRCEDRLLVVGNIAAEIQTLGEQRARKARYENDGNTFDAMDTVVNVVDAATVDETFGAFYAGAADQVFAVTRQSDGRRVAVKRALTDAAGTSIGLSPRSELLA